MVANSRDELEPGQRVDRAVIPMTPIATVAKRAVKPEDPRGGENMMVQVIRDEYVTNVPVRVLGETGTERVQITGALRVSDSLIVSTSVALLPGTLIRFGENGTGSNSVEAGIQASQRARPHAGSRVLGDPGCSRLAARSPYLARPAPSSPGRFRPICPAPGRIISETSPPGCPQKI